MAYPTYRPLAITRACPKQEIGDGRHDKSLPAKRRESAQARDRRLERNATKRTRYDGDDEMRDAARERARRYHARRRLRAAQANHSSEGATPGLRVRAERATAKARGRAKAAKLLAETEALFADLKEAGFGPKLVGTGPAADIVISL